MNKFTKVMVTNFNQSQMLMDPVPRNLLQQLSHHLMSSWLAYTLVFRDITWCWKGCKYLSKGLHNFLPSFPQGAGLGDYPSYLLWLFCVWSKTSQLVHLNSFTSNIIFSVKPDKNYSFIIFPHLSWLYKDMLIFKGTPSFHNHSFIINAPVESLRIFFAVPTKSILCSFRPKCLLKLVGMCLIPTD